MITATYSPEDNKIRLYATERLDAETYARVKAAGNAWVPKQGLFYAPAWTPQREDLALELAGEIGDEDKSLVERAEERADRFDGYAGRREQDAVSAERSASAIADGIPLGQPILIGHHSQRRAERDAEKIQDATWRAVKMWETSAYWLRRAEGAIAAAKYKEQPEVRVRRIKTIEADRRRQERVVAESTKLAALWEKAGEITLEVALSIAGYDHIRVREPGKSDWSSLWDKLKEGSMSPLDARARALKAHERSIAWAERWIAHYDNRLAYERAMLDASGYKEPQKAKRELLPLLNYRAASIMAQSPFRGGEACEMPVVEMTKAEFAKIDPDHRGTRVVGGTHRYRIAYQGHGKYAAVFLTDSKAHEAPSAEAKP
jgi:hypothetical protein